MILPFCGVSVCELWGGPGLGDEDIYRKMVGLRGGGEVDQIGILSKSVPILTQEAAMIQSRSVSGEQKLSSIDLNISDKYGKKKTTFPQKPVSNPSIQKQFRLPGFGEGRKSGGK